MGWKLLSYSSGFVGQLGSYGNYILMTLLLSTCGVVEEFRVNVLFKTC